MAITCDFFNLTTANAAVHGEYSKSMILLSEVVVVYYFT